MRIAVCHSFYDSTQPSGENVVVQDQVRALSEAGYDARLFSIRTDDVSYSRSELARTGLRVASGRGRNPHAEISSFRPDVVHVHNTFPNWGTAWARHYSDRLVVTLHNYRTVCAAGTLHRDGSACTLCPDQSSLNAVRHRCYRQSSLASMPLAIATRHQGSRNELLRSARALITLNLDQQHFYTDAPTSGKVHMIPNFVESSERDPIEQKNGWIFVGRLTEEKGLLDLLRVWPTDEQLYVAGDGPLAAAVASAQDRTDSVELLGSLSRQEVRHRVARANALILPSRWSEGVPTVMLEALADGVPVIAAPPVVAARPIVSAGAGVHFDFQNGRSTELVGALTSIRSNSAMYRVRALEIHRRRYSEAAWLESVSSVYKEVLAHVSRV
ncbi:hypothetical protein A7K94_0200755 [Modestobacter sp. VKM Ac-2676]|nr:hypothetical protein A7K94_0200755 [Modestobacter sp. VKM Ac-2676]